MIAVELYDNYNLTYYQLACKLDRGAGLNEDQHDALKMRGVRLYKEGKKMGVEKEP